MTFIFNTLLMAACPKKALQRTAKHSLQMLEAITLLYIVFQECNKAGLRAVFQQPENEGSAEWWQWRSGLVYSATAEVNAYQVSEL